AEIWSAIPEAEAPPPVVVEPRPLPPQAVEERQPEPETVPDLVIAQRKPRKEPKPERKPVEREVFDSTPVKPRKADPMQPPPDVRDKLAREQALKAQQAARDKADREAKEAKEAEARAQAALEAQRQRNLKDIVRNAGGGGASAGATGQASASAGPSVGYTGRLRALFRRNLINWSSEDLPGNPEVLVRVTVAPDGTILSRQVVTPSGSPVWDEAVLRAIDRTEVIPRDEQGRVHSPMTLSFRPKDY
ncbi:MAG: cell envelope integrity protein TolA, partial [Pseudomonadota bacterium]